MVSLTRCGNMAPLPRGLFYARRRRRDRPKVSKYRKARRLSAGVAGLAPGIEKRAGFGLRSRRGLLSGQLLDMRTPPFHHLALLTLLGTAVVQALDAGALIAQMIDRRLDRQRRAKIQIGAMADKRPAQIVDRPRRDRVTEALIKALFAF